MKQNKMVNKWIDKKKIGKEVIRNKFVTNDGWVLITDDEVPTFKEGIKYKKTEIKLRYHNTDKYGDNYRKVEDDKP